MNLEIIGKIAERKIQEGIEEGKFDNLPGMGKPLDLSESDSVPLDVRMANKVLKNAGVLPEWIQVQHEITSEREEMARYRERISAENAKRRARLETQKLPAEHAAMRQFAEWHARCRESYLRRLKQYNTSVLKFSIIAPSTATPFRSLKIDVEMEAFDAVFPTLNQQPEVVVPEAPKENMTKNLARARYQEGAGGGAMRGWTRAAKLFGLGRSRDVEDAEFDVDDLRRASQKDRP